MEKSQLREKIYSKIDELPTLPAVIPKILSLMKDKKSSVSDVTKVISRDPALTSKILKVANSAYYGFSQKITELDKALALLGFNMVKSLALSIGVIRSLPPGKRSPYFSAEGLWLHSLGVATIIKKIGKRFKDEALTEALFIIGLLHDIGKLVLDQFFSEQFLEALVHANNQNNEKSLHIVEHELIGITHCEVAEMLLTRWKFPDKIINPISYHHHKDSPEGIIPLDVSLLRVANSLVQQIGMGKEGNSVPNEIDESDLEIIKLKEEELEDLKSFLEGRRDEIDSFLQAMS